MKTHFATCLAIITLLLFGGCNESQIQSISINDFYAQINLEETRFETDEMLNIRNLIVQDSFLIINNSREDSIFMVFNLVTQKHLKSWGSKGRAPEEYGLFSHLLKVSSNEFQIADFSRYRIETYEIPTLALKSSHNILDNFQTNENRQIPQNIVTPDGHRYFFDNLLREDLTLNRWNIGEEPTVINGFDHSNDMFKSDKYKIGSMAINTDAGKIVYAYRFGRRFDIFNLEGEKERTTEVKPHPSPTALAMYIDRTRLDMCYVDAKALENSFFLLYIGHSPKEIENNEFLVSCYIEEYDWDGNPVNLYHLKRYISKFDVFKKNKTSVSFIGVDITNNNPLIIFDETIEEIK